MRQPSKVLALIVCLAVAGCSGSPTQPDPSLPFIPTSPVIPEVINNSAAAVTADDAYVLVHQTGSRFEYGVRFLLREASGKSGARIDGIDIYGPSGADAAGPACWRETLRVPAQGRLDTFYTDEGTSWLGYCGPGSGGTTASPSLAVIVTFRDDFGVTGAIRFPASVRR